VFNEHTDQHRSRLRRRQRRRTGDSPGPCDRSPQTVVRSTISPALELRANGHLRISLRQAQNRCLRSNSETQLGRARIEGITVATGGKVRSAPRCLVGKPACRESSPPAEHLRRIARHFRRRITCWIRRWLGQWLRRFKGRIAGWIMHRLVGRIAFGGSNWIAERLRWTSRGRGHGHLSSADAHVTAAGAETGRFSRTDPLRTSSPQIQRFLFIALAVWSAASFTTSFASPVAFWASPFNS
jgi:hypothetical protein